MNHTNNNAQYDMRSHLQLLFTFIWVVQYNKDVCIVLPAYRLYSIIDQLSLSNFQIYTIFLLNVEWVWPSAVTSKIPFTSTVLHEKVEILFHKASRTMESPPVFTLEPKGVYSTASKVVTMLHVGDAIKRH